MHGFDNLHGFGFTTRGAVNIILSLSPLFSRSCIFIIVISPELVFAGYFCVT